MTILTRQERERLVLDLYNLGKTYREISKEARISPRDIGVILNKVMEEKTEGLKEGQDNLNSEKNQEQEEQQHFSISARAYKLFSEGKTPLEVAIALNLRESEATKFYRECWKLQHLHNLNTVYEEIKGDIDPFLMLYKLAKRKGIGVRHVVDILAIANNDLPAIEERVKRLTSDVSMQQFQKHTCKGNLYQLNNQIASTTRLLNSFRMFSERERRKAENLCNEKTRLESIITEFKSNNEEYLNRVKQTAEENVKAVLMNSKLLLQCALASVIESLRSNSELYNFISYSTLVETASTSYGSNYYLSSMSGRQQQQQQSFNNTYTALILEEAEKLYNDLTAKLTNEIMAASSAAMKTISLPLPLPPSNNMLNLTHKNNEIEEPRYNNQSEI